jgi:hypothetical protein
MKRKLLFLITALSIWIVNCNTVNNEKQVTNPEEIDNQGYKTAAVSNITFKYKIVKDSLNCILRSNTKGWLAVGFNPSRQMKDANLIIGYVKDGTAFIRDDWGTANTAHNSDVSLGGTDNVKLISGNESDGITEIQFQLPLNSGDALDQVLSKDNSYTVILAKGNSDDFILYHAARGQTTITL